MKFASSERWSENCLIGSSSLRPRCRRRCRQCPGRLIGKSSRWIRSRWRPIAPPALVRRTPVRPREDQRRRAVLWNRAGRQGLTCQAFRPIFPSAAIFGPGFQLQTKDEEFQLQFHDLTQIDGRFYTQGQQVPVTSTFLIPRQWFIFSGRLTKPFEYYVSIAEGIDNLNILDVFLNVNFDPRLQFKIGRYKTPFTYEFYGLPINGFITPERSLFFNNFGLNRDIGLMAWGQTVRQPVRLRCSDRQRHAQRLRRLQ